MKQSKEKYVLDSHAKINLFLEILGKREDGFHDILSVFQEVSLADRIEAFSVESTAITLQSDMAELPCDETNLVIKAASRLREEVGGKDGIAFRLQKNIPVGGGLGGGSSNAAAALRLACRVWKINEEQDLLQKLAEELGSDVPFFLQGGTCLCEGRGERVTPLDTAPALSLQLLLPPWGVNTASAYKALQGCKLGIQSVEGMLGALAKKDTAGVLQQSFNRFEEVMDIVEPRQSRLHAALGKNLGLTWRMSGSGSSVWCGGEVEETSNAWTECISGMGCIWVESVAKSVF